MKKNILLSGLCLVLSSVQNCDAQSQSRNNSFSPSFYSAYTFDDALEKTKSSDLAVVLTGFAELKQLARSGHPDAMLEVSNCYLNAIGTQKNEKMAYIAVKVAAEKGSAEGAYRMAFFLTKGIGTDKNESLARSKLRQAADQNHKNAISDIASESIKRYFKTNRGGRELRRWSERGCSLNIACCYFALGTCYRLGIDVKIDTDRAFSLYQKGAAMKNEDSMVALAQCYLDGEDREVDEVKALKLLEEASKGNNEYAIFEFAETLNKLLMEDRDEDVQWNPLQLAASSPEALKLKYQQEVTTQLDRAIALGSTDAMNLKAKKLSTGEGCTKDLAGAFALANESHKHNDIQGTCQLAEFYSEGVGVGKNAKKATSLYGEAAKKGSPQAQFEYGVRFATGNGVRVNVNSSQRWINRSAQNGCQEAIQYLTAQAEQSMPVLSGWQTMSPTEQMLEDHHQSQVDEYVREQERSSQFMRDRDGY